MKLEHAFPTSEGQWDDSADEVHHNQVEDRVSEEEVSKRSFWGDGEEISFVLGVDLDAKTNCEGIRTKETCQKFSSHPGQREMLAELLHLCDISALCCRCML